MKNCETGIQKFFNILLKVPRYIYCIFLLVILILMVFVCPFYKHILLTDFVNNNYLYLILAVIAGALLAILSIKIKFDEKKYKIFILMGLIILFCLQMFVVYGKLFVAGWDVHEIYFPKDTNDYYFSIYPNNLFLRGFFSCVQNIIFLPIYNFLISHVPAIASISVSSIVYIFAVFLSCVCVLLSVLLLTLIIKHLLGSKISIIWFVFISIFVGLMPWILVPYSDTFSLFFVSLIVYAYFCITNKCKKITIMLIAGIIGFSIKPVVIFVLVSIIFVEICLLIINNSKIRILNIKQILVVLLACVLSFGFVFLVKNSTNLNIDTNKERTMTHFLMLGFCPEKEGIHSEIDDQISDSASNVNDRENLNLKKTKEYINSMGIAGTFKLLIKKTLANYSDGTFMWGKDGGANFCLKQIGNNKIVNWYYDNYAPFAQVLWFVLLLGSLLNLFTKNSNKSIYVSCTILLLQSTFLMIFECGSRYLIMFLPFFIILACTGLNDFSNFLECKLNKVK